MGGGARVSDVSDFFFTKNPNQTKKNLKKNFFEGEGRGDGWLGEVGLESVNFFY